MLHVSVEYLERTSDLHLSTDTDRLVDRVDEFLPAEMGDSLAVKFVCQPSVVSQAGNGVGHVCFSEFISHISDRMMTDSLVPAYATLTWQHEYPFLRSGFRQPLTCLDPFPSSLRVSRVVIPFRCQLSSIPM